MVMGGRVYLGDLAGILHCISAVDGKKVWLYDCENGIHSSCNSDGVNVLFGNDGAQILCIDTEGKKVWMAEAGDRINSAPSIATLADGRRVALFSGCDSTLRALELKEGKEIFAAEMGNLAGGSPAVAGDRIVVGTDRGHVLCFDLAGKPLWDFDKIADEAMVYDSPAVSEGIVGGRGARSENLRHRPEDREQKWVFGDARGRGFVAAGERGAGLHREQGQEAIHAGSEDGG